MSEEEQSTHNDSTLVVSRIRFAGFVFLATGALALTIANAWGETALRSLLLAILTVVFVLGGGLFGLLATQHLALTHLPEGRSNEEADRQSLEELRAERELRRAKGFLDLFTLSPDTAPRDGLPRPPRKAFRRTA